VRSLRKPRTIDGGRRARSFLGGVISASVYASTRWRCGRRGSVLSNEALRSVRVSMLLVLRRHCGDGGCKLGFWGTGEGRTADGRQSTHLHGIRRATRRDSEHAHPRTAKTGARKPRPRDRRSAYLNGIKRHPSIF